MKPLMVALIALAGAAGATTSSAGDVSSLLEETKTFCIANHSDPALVIKAAESAEWKRAPSPDAAAPKLVRKADGAYHFIDLITQERAAGSTRFQRRDCALSVLPPLKGDLVEQVRDYLGHGPTISTDKGATAWLYTEQGGRREFLSSPGDIESALHSGRGPVLYLYVYVRPNSQGLTYSEMTPD